MTITEKMTTQNRPHFGLLIVEGNHEGLVGKTQAGQPYGAAERFAETLSALAPGLTVQIIRPHFAADPAPAPDWAAIDGAVFTGAGVSWAADDAAAQPARAVMEAAFSCGLPVFGSCYGMQVGVAVLGGSMYANPAGVELAIARQITVTEAGREHRLYKGKPVVFDALCMHRDNVKTLPRSLVCLASNQHCSYQAVSSTQTAADQFSGVQYHPELRFSDIAGFLRRADVEGFSQAVQFTGKGPGFTADLSQMISDFMTLDSAPETKTLLSRYQIGTDIIDRQVHETELANWLSAVAAKKQN